jgi:uncharacterized protein (TIGR03435 family)
MNTRISNLIAFAWSIKYYQLVGAPEWTESDRYDVEAVAEGNPSDDEMKAMLRLLLEDRLQLKVRREIKQQTVYALKVSKNGPKIQRSKAGECVQYDPATTASSAADPGRFCGFNILSKGRWNASAITMAQVASALSDLTSRPVLDQTGLRGNFDVHIDYVEDELANGATGQSIFAAVQERLGLVLQTTKGPAEVLVVDHIERPSAN